ncbi:MAG TPA: TonB family protein [Rhodocyclaceae bacterium]|nr:TonB family protein [Rhodocyclaceae bacterium]
MIGAQLNPAFNNREDPGKWGSLLLTLFIHGVLVLVLFYGVQWQRHTPEPVQVDLVRSLPAPIPEPPKPVVTPEPAPKPVPKEVAPPPVKKPDIALPKPEEKPLKKEEKKPPEPPKPVEKPQPKPQEKAPEPAKPQLDPREREAQRQRDLLNMDLDRLRRQDQAQANARNKADRDATAGKATDKARGEWTAAISQKVRGHLSAAVPPGDPTAEFAIELLPSGEVASVRLTKSSGNKALDDAMLRAIYASSPLPKPSQPDVFVRNLNFVFKPGGD